MSLWGFGDIEFWVHGDSLTNTTKCNSALLKLIFLLLPFLTIFYIFFSSSRHATEKIQ